MPSRVKVYYVRQPNMRVFRSVRSLQRGHGIGGLFRGLMRAATPIVKSSLLKAGQKALNMGVDVLKDIQQNDASVKEVVLKKVLGSKPINRRGKKRKAISSKKSTKRKVVLEKVTIPKL